MFRWGHRLVAVGTAEAPIIRSILRPPHGHRHLRPVFVDASLRLQSQVGMCRPRCHSLRHLHVSAATLHGHGHGHGHDDYEDDAAGTAHSRQSHERGPASPHEHRHPREKEHTENAQNITIAGIVVNIGLTGAKGVLGVLSNSSALVADAAHSFSDLLSDFVTLWGVRLSRRPATKRFPFGYGRSESVAACVVSLMLMGTGVGMIDHCVRLLLSGELMGPTGMTNYAIATAVASIVLKEALYQRTAWLAKGMDSSALHANAWHHRTDALSSVVSLGALVGQKYGFAFIDPVGGVIVAWIILKAGYSIGKSSLRELLDMSTGTRLHRELAHTIRAASGERAFHEYLRVRKVGPHHFVSVRMCVDGTTTASEFEGLCDRVRRDICAQLPSAREVVIELSTHARPGHHDHVRAGDVQSHVRRDRDDEGHNAA